MQVPAFGQSSAPRAVVVVFPGSNGDRDLLEALQKAGFNAQAQRSHEPLPVDCALVGLPGGFSYGDYWRAGMLSSQAQAVRDLPAHVDRGGLVIGICNGFQILVEAGLLPGALRANIPSLFRHRWTSLVVPPESKTPWLHGISPGTELRMPYAHGEGNYFHPDGQAALTGELQGRTALRYRDNPNGSLGDIAGLLDDTGRVLGIMPHPERAADALLGGDDGLRLFAAARLWLSGSDSSDVAQ